MMRLLAIAIALFGAGAAMAECRPDIVDIRHGGGQVQFEVEVVDTFEGRTKGLMHREHMARFSGMLFVYERPQSVSFWMRNTLIPLDMLFIDETGTVQKVHAKAIPLDETPIPGGNDILEVLEINGGLAAQLGIRPGAEIRHPSLNPEIAAWPCGD